ncbi:MAG: sensor histidine kinase [Clostridia bacterium]
MMKQKDLHFKVSSGLKNLIGRELITDQYIAIFELVKNGYDAGASKVDVIFENTKTIDDAKIRIVDNGSGMSLDDINNKWLFVAFSEKNIKKVDNGRTYAGAKGVGRFSCDRLGSKLILTTKKKGYPTEKIIIEWDKFEEDTEKLMMEIQVQHETVKDCEYIKESGTVLEISNLHDVWDRNSLIHLKRSLEKLIDPNQNIVDKNFNIELKAEDEIAEDLLKNNDYNKIVNTNIKNTVFETLVKKTIKINAEVKRDIIEIQLADRDTRIYSIKLSNTYEIDNISIEIYFLNELAKRNFKAKMGISCKDYGSIFMYRNGFRVYPFGEPGDDQFGLDQRKNQGFKRYLGTRELLGRIEIKGDGIGFKETTSRDGGFIKTKEYDNLKNLVIYEVLRRLETYIVEVIEWGVDSEVLEDNSINNIQKYLSKISNGKNKNIIEVDYDNDILKELEKRSSKSINKSIKDIKEIAIEREDKTLYQKVDSLGKEFEEKKKEIESKDEIIENKTEEIEQVKAQKYFLTNTIGKDVKEFMVLQHQIARCCDTIEKGTNKITEILRKENISKEDIERAKKAIASIGKENEIILMASDTITNANYNSEFKKIKVDLVQYIAEYIENVYNASQSHRQIVKVEVEDNIEFIKEISPLEVSIIFNNLFSNAIKANATRIKVIITKNNTQLYIRVLDNGIGIKEKDKDYIFDFGYTTRFKGTGLGLYHTKEIIKELNGEIYYNDENRNETEFVIKVGQ